MAITDPAAPLGPALESWLATLAAAGVDALQVRRKELADRALLALVERCRAALPASVAVLVNGRVDVAVAAGADGVHLPAAGLATADVSRLARRLGARLLIGRSTHTAAEAARELAEGADYVTFGPLYPTPSKASSLPPAGAAGLREAARAGLPVLALGGVDAARVAEVAAAGAHGVAAIRAFYEPGGPARMVEAMRRVLGPLPVVDSGPP
jgi:thiamine-phosphate pyrophosphorylase